MIIKSENWHKRMTCHECTTKKAKSADRKIIHTKDI
jgi:hypothetical protein